MWRTNATVAIMQLGIALNYSTMMWNGKCEKRSVRLQEWNHTNEDMVSVNVVRLKRNSRKIKRRNYVIFSVRFFFAILLSICRFAGYFVVAVVDDDGRCV